MADRTIVLDWRDHTVGPLVPCRLCGLPAVMRDAQRRPCHKVCAELWLVPTEAAKRAALFAADTRRRSA